MNTSKNISYNELFTIIEDLYIEDNYNQIINIKDRRPDIDFLDSTKMNYCEFAEVFAISYIKLGLFQKALIIIDKHIQYLLALGLTSEEHFDDLTTFYLMKIEIYKNQNSTLKQLRCVLNYIRFGGKDKQILELKFELEDALYMKYVVINKVLLYLTFGLSLLWVLSILNPSKSFFTIVTPTVLIWILLNYVFWKKIKQLYLKLIRRYLLQTSKHLFSG